MPTPQVLHSGWILLAAVNFIVQLACFFNERSRPLFIAKKATTPLLLFSGLGIVMIGSGGFPLIPGLILAFMGLGELGIEGSGVVEADRDTGRVRGADSLVVTLAGALFLLVNIFIGTVLLYRCGALLLIAGSLLLSTLFFSTLLALFFSLFKPPGELRFQISLYSLSLMVLAAGVLTDIPEGLTPLGGAAALLTLSDFLVLIRMGAGFNRKSRRGFFILLAFLIVILLLYYLFIAVLIRMAGSFPG
jgi:hypothetical protein